MILNEITDAIKEAIKRAGNQMALAESSLVSQGQISDYLCGRRKIENMTLGTFVKLFPESEVKYFRDTQVKPDVSSSIEKQVISILRSLDPDNQVRCLAKIGRDSIKKETKKF